jgi:1-deoxy-D-xylulose-5-phosphate synthase
MLYTEIPTQRPVTPLLDAIDHPQQLRQLEHSQLLQVADELRQYILYAAGQSGGHFGANLGVVELTVALHYCFNTPNDRLVWDVGHQAYPHKILTGRREQITTIRAKNGLAAFPAREESVFDTFGVGHSSTAISAGLGMSLARRYQKDPCEVVCIVGDGAMTAGMAFEAMNDAVAHDADLIVVLNDNDMSISCSTGGFAKHLAAIWEKGHLVNVNEHGEAYIQPHPKWTYNSRLQYGYGWQIILNNLTIYQLLSSSLYKKENLSVQNDYDNSTNLPALRYTLNRFRLKDELICAYRVHCNIKTPDRFW